MYGVRAAFQRHCLSMTEPLHQKPHGGNMIFSVQQGSHHLRKAAGGFKVFDMLTPERNITSGLAGRAPFREHSSNLCGGLYRFHTFDM